MAGNLRAYFAELMGTFALIFVGAGAVCMDSISRTEVGLVGIALAHGLTIMVMIWALGHLSGGHFNPAVTLAMLSTRRISASKAAGYVAFQLLGAALAGLLLSRILHNFDVIDYEPFLGLCRLDRVSFKGGAALEAMMTFFLALVIYGTAVDENNKTPMAPLAIGMTITLCILVGGPVTGAALNPARAFGPALVTGRWAGHLVYWAGPIVGACAAALLYEYVLMEKKQSQPAGQLP